jgi:hypothetical protein
MMYAVEMASWGMIYLPSFIKIGTGVQAISRFGLIFFRGSDGITNGRNLWCTPLRWLHAAFYNYQVSWRLVEAFKQYYDLVSDIWEVVMLVLLKGGIYDIRRWDGVMWHDIITKFHEDCYRRSSNIKIRSQIFERLWCGTVWKTDLTSMNTHECAFPTAHTVPEETTVARNWYGKHVSTAANIPATIDEPREAVFSLGSVPRLTLTEQETIFLQLQLRYLWVGSQPARTWTPEESTFFGAVTK